MQQSPATGCPQVHQLDGIFPPESTLSSSCLGRMGKSSPQACYKRLRTRGRVTHHGNPNRPGPWLCSTFPSHPFIMLLNCLPANSSASLTAGQDRACYPKRTNKSISRKVHCRSPSTPGLPPVGFRPGLVDFSKQLLLLFRPLLPHCTEQKRVQVTKHSLSPVTPVLFITHRSSINIRPPPTALLSFTLLKIVLASTAQCRVGSEVLPETNTF